MDYSFHAIAFMLFFLQSSYSNVHINIVLHFNDASVNVNIAHECERITEHALCYYHAGLVHVNKKGVKILSFRHVTQMSISKIRLSFCPKHLRWSEVQRFCASISVNLAMNTKPWMRYAFVCFCAT